MGRIRIGQGYDVHGFAQGRPLVLGGVKIPYVLGLHGHSDADVLTHAVCDAILGAAGLRDIGFHFPDNDPDFEGIDSQKLLTRVVELAWEKRRLTVTNVDVTVIAEKPKLLGHIDKMHAMMAPTLAKTGGPGEINIKATTSEGMGFVGRAEGIAAQAVALLEGE